MTYTVKVLEGEFPESVKEVSVFIDVIGMPLKPALLFRAPPAVVIGGAVFYEYTIEASSRRGA